jgi:acetyl-CoA C-acetyltransferase
MSNREVMVVSGVRTAIGGYGGSLKDMPPTKLGATAIKEAVSRARVDPASVGHVVMGSVIHGEAKDMYLSRVAAVEAGLPVGTPCLTVNRLCGSGLQAIVSAAQHLMLGDCDIAVAGGAESMSRAAYFLPAGRWGQRMGDAPVVDAMSGALHDPFGHGHMGVTAENIAEKYGFSRVQQDEFAVESHRRAADAL